MTSSRHRAGILTVAFCLALSACGFQLRGSQQVSLAVQPLAVDCQQVPAGLCSAVTDQLELNNVTLAPQSEAGFLLRLSDFSRQRRATAITASAAAAEYTLRHSVDLQIITSDRIPLINPVSLDTSETYRYDETNVLAKRREEASLEEQLNSRLAQQVVFRLVPLTRERIDAMREAHQRSQSGESAP